MLVDRPVSATQAWIVWHSKMKKRGRSQGRFSKRKGRENVPWARQKAGNETRMSSRE